MGTTFTATHCSPLLLTSSFCDPPIDLSVAMDSHSSINHLIVTILQLYGTPVLTSLHNWQDVTMWRPLDSQQVSHIAEWRDSDRTGLWPGGLDLTPYSGTCFNKVVQIGSQCLTKAVHRRVAFSVGMRVDPESLLTMHSGKSKWWLNQLVEGVGWAVIFNSLSYSFFINHGDSPQDKRGMALLL